MQCPLSIFRGARQTGKTWLLKEFGKREFKKCAYISLYNNPSGKAIFEGSYDAKRILSDLSILSDTTITPGDTLVVLDEIQDVPRTLDRVRGSLSSI